MNKETVSILKEVINPENFENVVPFIKDSIKILERFGQEISPLVDKLIREIARKRINLVKYYIELGCTRQEAILFTLNDEHGMKESIKQWKTNSEL